MKVSLKSVVSRLWRSIHFVLMLVLFVQSLSACAPFATADIKAALAVYAIVLFLMTRIYGCYRVGLLRLGELFYSFIIANTLAWLVVFTAVCARSMAIPFLLPPLLAFLTQTLLTALWLFSANKLYFRLYKPSPTVILYRSERDLQKLEEVHFFSAKWKVLTRLPVADNEDAVSLLKDRAADCDTVFVSGLSECARNQVALYCAETGRECYFVPCVGDVLISGATHMRTFTVPVLRVRRKTVSLGYRLGKRAFDVLFSLTALILLSPIMLCVAIAIKAEDGGKVLYRQTRLTRDRKEFTILKFRSMRENAEAEGAMLSSASDTRVTATGRFLRATRLDELPQLLNVLRGDMSLVGPRPERPELAAEYEKTLPDFALRLQVKAGLTGYAQVYGRYDTEPADKLKMDLMYINNIGFAEDLKILFATLKVVLEGHGSR